MSEAKEYLLQIRKLEELITGKRWELEQMLAAAEGMTAYGEDVVIDGQRHALDKVQTSGNPQRMADAVCSYVDVKTRALQDIAGWQAEQQERISMIQPLPETEYKLLHRVYVQGMTLRDAADDLERSYSWATTVHGIALKRVQEALDKRKKEGTATCSTNC